MRWVARSYLDPLSGTCLHTEAVVEGAARTITTLPRRWVASAR
jgi:hypothetical protein